MCGVLALPPHVTLLRSIAFVSVKKKVATKDTAHSAMTYRENSQAAFIPTNSWFRYGALPPKRATDTEKAKPIPQPRMWVGKLSAWSAG